MHMWYSLSMITPKAALFDLDDTLAESFKPPTRTVIAKLEKILSIVPVAILTGAGFQRIQDDTLSQFDDVSNFSRFYILPNSAAQAYSYREDDWVEEYSFKITPSEREQILNAIESSIEETQVLKNLKPKGQQFFDRDVQIAYAFLGDGASAEEKAMWDPLGEKRGNLKVVLEEKLPDFEILVGGTTTIDITKKGINKAYGVRWLSKQLSIPCQDMLYVGDALFTGGNDEVVIETGARTIQVSGPDETLPILDEILKSLG